MFVCFSRQIFTNLFLLYAHFDVDGFSPALQLILFKRTFFFFRDQRLGEM